MTMTPVSFAKVADLYPHLVKQVIDKIGQNYKGLSPKEIAWHLVTCHDDPEQPMDEAVAADLLLTGCLRCRNGVCGKIGQHYACYCDEGCEPLEQEAPVISGSFTSVVARPA
jgi:hypothetical protein